MFCSGSTRGACTNVARIATPKAKQADLKYRPNSMRKTESDWTTTSVRFMQICTHSFSFPFTDLLGHDFARLWSADGGRCQRESEAESGEERLAERSRSETPPRPTDGSTPFMRSSRIQIVTSTRFAQRNGRGGEGERADRKPVERVNRVLVTLEKYPPITCG